MRVPDFLRGGTYYRLRRMERNDLIRLRHDSAKSIVLTDEISQKELDCLATIGPWVIDSILAERMGEVINCTHHR
jgi:hypothetical protein